MVGHDGRQRVHVENLVLDIGGETGALILFTGADYRGREVELSLVGRDGTRVHTAIHERRVAGATVFAGVFPDLPAGIYRIWTDDPGLQDRVTIVGGQVSEVDWRPDRRGATDDAGPDDR